MDEIGIQVSLPDYRLLFDQIDFDVAGEIDYFKFCLLDVNKTELRANLAQEHQLSLLNPGQESQRHSRTRNYSLTNVTKNKELNKFMQEMKSKSFQQVFLDSKLRLNAQCSGRRQVSDLPLNFAYGVKTVQQAEKFDDLIQNRFTQ